MLFYCTDFELYTKYIEVYWCIFYIILLLILSTVIIFVWIIMWPPRIIAIRMSRLCQIVVILLITSVPCQIRISAWNRTPQLWSWPFWFVSQCCEELLFVTLFPMSFTVEGLVRVIVVMATVLIISTGSVNAFQSSLKIQSVFNWSHSSGLCPIDRIVLMPKMRLPDRFFFWHVRIKGIRMISVNTVGQVCGAVFYICGCLVSSVFTRQIRTAKHLRCSFFSRSAGTFRIFPCY